MTDRLVRSASTVASRFATPSVTFAESTPLDNTHLLVAVVIWASATPLTAPAGWTEAPGGGANTLQARVYARRGDGSVNSFTMTGPSGPKSVYLLGFSGYVSATAAAGEGSNLTPTAGAYTVPTLSSPPSVDGVAIIAAAGTSFDGTWDNGYTLTAPYPTAGTGRPARKVYEGPGGSWGATFTNGGTDAGRGILVVYELV